jgi:nucleotide-binding universal stress UspA family protein
MAQAVFPAYRCVVASTIVVGYDGAERSTKALDRAIDEAREDGAPLVEPPELEPVLAQAKERVESAGLTGEYMWAAGDPANEIVEAAKDRGAGLIVIGSHHHSLFARILGPDVATQIKRDAGCDVIVAD